MNEQIHQQKTPKKIFESLFFFNTQGTCFPTLLSTTYIYRYIYTYIYICRRWSFMYICVCVYIYFYVYFMFMVPCTVVGQYQATLGVSN